MPIRAEVDGVGIMEFPDGTDPAVIQMTVKRVIARGTPEQRYRGLTGENLPPPRNALSSVAHGGIDAAEGIAQIAARGATALGLPPGSDYPFIASPDIVEQRTNEARSAVDKALGVPSPQGMDFLRAGSGAALVSPYMGPVGTAPTMLGRAGQAARAGAIQGGAQPVEGATDGKDFLKTKMFQAGTGAVFGGVSQPALEFGTQGVASLANAAANRARGAVQDTSENTAALIAAQTLAQQGVKFNTLAEDVQKSLIKDVQEALKKYGGVNPAALGRQADFKALEIDPLKPWVTRDPVEWGRYKNLEGSRDAGEPLIQARAALDRQLMNRIEGLRGGNAGDSYQAGTIAGNALKRSHDAAKDKVAGLYDTFHRLAPDVTLDGTRLTSEIYKSIDAQRAMRFLPQGLKDELDDIALGKTPATPSVLYQLQKLASRESRKGGNEGYAAGVVSRGIDDELARFSDEFKVVGPEMAQAAGALKQARAAHRELKMSEEAIPALRDVAEGKYAAEDFFNRYILGGDVKEVAAMWSKTGSEVKQAARSQLIDFLKQKAAGSGADDAAVFRQGNFTEALGSPGMKQKIQILLGEKGLAEIQRIQRAGESAIRTPAGARYNTSGTAAELMNLARRGAGVPVLGPMVAEPMQKLMAQQQAAGMARPASVGAGLMDPFLEEILRRARQGSGLLSPAVGGLMASEFSK